MRCFRKHTQYNDIEIFLLDRGDEVEIVTLKGEEVINYDALPHEGICDRVIIKPLKAYYVHGPYDDYMTYFNCYHGLPEPGEIEGLPTIKVYIKVKENNNEEGNFR